MSDETKIAVPNAQIVPNEEVTSVNNTFNLTQDGSGTNIGVAQKVEQNNYQIYMLCKAITVMGMYLNISSRSWLTPNTSI